MTEDSVHIGLLRGRFDDLSKRVDRLQDDMSDQNVKLDKILEGVNRAKGAFWLLSAVGTVAAGVGAAFHALLQYFQGNHP